MLAALQHPTMYKMVLASGSIKMTKVAMKDLFEGIRNTRMGYNMPTSKALFIGAASTILTIQTLITTCFKKANNTKMTTSLKAKYPAGLAFVTAIVTMAPSAFDEYLSKAAASFTPSTASSSSTQELSRNKKVEGVLLEKIESLAAAREDVKQLPKIDQVGMFLNKDKWYGD